MAHTPKVNEKIIQITACGKTLMGLSNEGRVYMVTLKNDLKSENHKWVPIVDSLQDSFESES